MSAVDRESEAHAIAARTWSFRARAEAEATLRFERLSERLVRLDATREVVQLARGAAVDERRHLGQCLELAAHFGATGKPPTIERLDEVGVPGLSAREQVLYELVASCCITETLSAAALLEMRDHASSERVADTVHAILRDEIRHSRLGWAHLAAEQRRGVGEMLATFLPSMLASAVGGVFEEVGSDPSVSAAGLGVLPHAARRRVAVSTLEAVVLPGLAHLGVETHAAERWLQAKVAETSPGGPRPVPWARAEPACTLPG